MGKAQVTYFLMVIVVLGLVIIFTGVAWEKEPQLEVLAPGDKQSVAGFIDNCLDLALSQATKRIGEQGGFLYPPEPSWDFDTITVPYYVFDSHIRMPSKERVQEELSRALEHYAYGCFSNFSAYRAQGYEIRQESMAVSVTFADGLVNADVLMAIAFKKGQSEFRFGNFKVEEDVDFSNMYDAAISLMESQRNDVEGIPLSSLAKAAAEYGFYFYVEYLDNETVLYQLDFRQNAQKNTTLNFAAKYAWNFEGEGGP